MSYTHVLLLRSPQRPSDNYETAFASSGLVPHSIPALETVLVNESDFRDIVRAGAKSRDFDGVIVTSARASDAWSAAVLSIDPDGTRTDSDWKDIPFYAVGSATATALASIAINSNNSLFAPQDIRGTESGIGERLAHFVLGDRNDKSSTTGNKTYLYLTGDKNRDTLPNILTEGGAEVQSIKVYETRGSPAFSTNLSECLSSLPPGLHEWWIVHFAPSAADFVTPIIRIYFDLLMTSVSTSGTPVSPSLTRHVAHVAAIGTTTATFLRNSLGISVEVVSPKPTPEALLSAIQSYEPPLALSLPTSDP